MYRGTALLTEVYQTRHAGERYRLRLHRARSVILSPQELVEIRAAQRTFEGAYVRTSLSQFSFALIVLKIFTSEFYSIGALFAIYGGGVLAVSAFRRMQGNRQFFSEIGDDGLSRKRCSLAPSRTVRSVSCHCQRRNKLWSHKSGSRTEGRACGMSCLVLRVRGGAGDVDWYHAGFPPTFARDDYRRTVGQNHEPMIDESGQKVEKAGEGETGAHMGVEAM
nr:hypothetical protein CFP56_64167 [Quercus suber]